MKILFIDTSSFFINVAIIDDNKVLVKVQKEIRTDMSSIILPIIRDCFNYVDFELKDLQKIFVVNGPGSFTGIRVGVSIAKVIAWGFNIPIIPVSSLELLATTNQEFKYSIPIIDARRGNVFGAIYDRNLNIILNEQLISKEELLNNIDSNYLVISNDFEKYTKPNLDFIKIIKKHEKDVPVNPHHLNPRYLKLTEAEENLKNV